MFHIMPSSTFPDYLLFRVSSQEYVFFCLFLHFLFDCLIVEFSMEKALSQTQQEADTHAHATQDAVSAKAAIHDQVKPIVDLAMHAANNVQDAILAAHAREPQEAVAKFVSEAQDALAHAKNLPH